MSGDGFALVVALTLLVLIAVLALGMTSLAAIELRRSSAGDYSATARANARFALMQAIGQLQRTMGPDQRVSATAEILGGTPKQPHWTGVWRSTRDDGSPIFERDDLAGGLRDTREDLKTTAAERVVEWLVSGSGDPLAASVGDPVALGRDESDRVIEVSKVALRRADGSLAGRHGWWTGDLGVRANVATRDAWKELAEKPGGNELGKWFRVMASQAADLAMMDGGKVFEDEEIPRLVSARTPDLTSAGPSWGDRHVFNVTVDSQGVLADVANGGLKRDLTAFMVGNGRIPEWKGLPGLTPEDPVVAHLEPPPAKASRTALASPRFGLLRDWARIEAPLDGRNVEARLPETDPSAGGSSAALALANEDPVKLAGNTRAGLQPILVEATNFIHLSTFRLAETNPAEFQLRHHHYPRVVLWNPYNVELDFARSMIMIQGNGRQEMWTENEHYDKNGKPLTYRSMSQWLSFEGGRSTYFDASGRGIMNTEGYNDPYMGSYYFSIPATKFKPGECLVFSPARSAEYDCMSVYRPGPYNLNANELSCTLPPDPSRSYYISGTDLDGGMRFRPLKFWYAPTPAWSTDNKGVRNQADDTRAILKHVGDFGTVTFEDFDSLPQISVVSSSLQYGAGREPRIAWSLLEKMPMELLDQGNPRPTVIPNTRTREGVRLRWFDEHPSNTDNSGMLNGTAYMEDALLGNWNPRAPFVVRSPWENIGGELPKSGSAGGPWFFGAYTRDLFDEAVSWGDQVPVVTGGRCHGNPFGPPQEGAARYVLFDVPRRETGVISLGQFQHAKLSELIWHPSYAIGNSLADPRLGTGGTKGLNRSSAVSPDAASSSVGGFHENQLGWSADTERAKSRNEWAVTARAILGEAPGKDNLVYDLSFEANQVLWDRYFLSTGSPEDKRSFVASPQSDPLPNGRLRLAPGGPAGSLEDDLTDFHKAASRLMVDGAFNVNSTRAESWKALLGSTRVSGYGKGGNIPFPRVLDPPGGAWTSDSATDGDEVWAGHRELTPEEIDKLAEAIVTEVKARGPFLSMADFVNRRLAEDETGRMGALQAAIEKAGLNAPLAKAYPLDNSRSLPDYGHPDNIADCTRMEQTLKPASMAWGAPAWLTQADVLQVIGPALSARSDTFVIRGYGEAVDAGGKTTARAWCEAVVQRVPAPLAADDSGLNPRIEEGKPDFGRRFVIQSFRWLAPEEI